MRGTVKWFRNDKGYGFIRSDDGKEYFVHYSDIIGEGYKKLEEGDSVSFKVGRTDRGEKAIEVSLL